LGIFNISEKEQDFCLAPYLKELKGTAVDLWKDTSIDANDSLVIPSHGVLLLRTDSVVK